MGFFSWLFGKKKQQHDDMPDDVRQAIGNLVSILNDDEKQNALFMPSFLQEQLIDDDLDEMKTKDVVYGRNPLTPIAVNGPIGEITYLSRLITNTGQHICFHRIGVLKTLGSRFIDAYETVSWDGSTWDILYFNYYYRKKKTFFTSWLSICRAC